MIVMRSTGILLLHETILKIEILNSSEGTTKPPKLIKYIVRYSLFTFVCFY